MIFLTTLNNNSNSIDYHHDHYPHDHRRDQQLLRHIDPYDDTSAVHVVHDDHHRRSLELDNDDCHCDGEVTHCWSGAEAEGQHSCVGGELQLREKEEIDDEKEKTPPVVDTDDDCHCDGEVRTVDTYTNSIGFGLI